VSGPRELNPRLSRTHSRWVAETSKLARFGTHSYSSNQSASRGFRSPNTASELRRCLPSGPLVRKPPKVLTETLVGYFLTVVLPWFLKVVVPMAWP